MDMRMPGRRDHWFVIGLVAGTFAGAGLAMWLVPHAAAELRRRCTDSARRLRQRAAGEYEKASARVGAAADALGRKGQRVRDDVADAVARGAHEVERYATAARTDRGADARSSQAGN